MNKGVVMKKLFILPILLIPVLINAQTVYEIPFLSKGNEIELAITNSVNITLKDVTVKIIKAPEWVELIKNREDIPAIKTNGEKTITFSFNIKRTAKINTNENIVFSIKNDNVEYEKTIAIKVAAPKQYTLYQNYPNPFNPTTKIEYDLPKENNVSLFVYDILGREVLNLVNETQKEGHYLVEFNGRGLASGIYFYNLRSGSYVQSKKMILVK